MNNKLIELENSLNNLTSQLSSLEGQCTLLNEQNIVSQEKIEQLDHNKEVYKKSVELLTIVEKSTKDVIKKGFEEIVTYALQYILNSSEYSLQLEFGRRGNLQEVDFHLKTPDCKEPHDPLLSSGGGVLDILSLALRISLIGLTKPKIEGFLALDEPFKHLSSNYIPIAGNFVKTISRRINRQVIMVTHKSELVNNADKAIKIGEK